MRHTRNQPVSFTGDQLDPCTCRMTAEVDRFTKDVVSEEGVVVTPGIVFKEEPVGEEESEDGGGKICDCGKIPTLT